MKQYSIAEARKNLALLVDQAAHGAEVMITRNGKPVATISAIKTEKIPTPGFAKGTQISDDFDEIPEGFEDYV